jgi:TonB family protein
MLVEVSLLLCKFPLLVLAALAVQAQTRPTAKIPPDVAAFMEGVSLNEDQVGSVEKTLDKSPDDLNAHFKLLGYYSMRKNGEDDEKSDFAKNLLWTVDHNPESMVFEIGIIGLNWEPSSALWNEYTRHWEQAAATHPKDAAVLTHAAQELAISDPLLALGYARKSVDADHSCTHCRNVLGSIIGGIILRRLQTPGGLKKGWMEGCLPNSPDVEQTVSNLRQEIETSSDPEILVDTGLTLRSFDGSKCGVTREDSTQLGNKLLRKAVSLDPSLIDRRDLRNDLYAKELSNQPKAGQDVQPAKIVHYVRPDYPDSWKREGLQGTVHVRITIAKDGSVRDVNVVDGDSRLAKSALKAVKQWRYSPALKNGEPVELQSTAAVTFALKAVQ